VKYHWPQGFLASCELIREQSKVRKVEEEEDGGQQQSRGKSSSEERQKKRKKKKHKVRQIFFLY